MAVYRPIQIRKDEEITSLVKKLYRFSENLRFAFADLDEDNLTAETIDHMQRRNEQIRNIKFDSEEFEMAFADHEKDVYAQMEQTEEKIGFLVEKGKVAETMMTRMELYGDHIDLTTGHVIVEANNWTLDKDGNTEFSGEIIGGTIAIGNVFLVTEEGRATLVGDTKQSFSDGIRRLTVHGRVEIEDSDLYGAVVTHGSVDCGSTVHCIYHATAKSFRLSSDARMKEEVEEVGPAADIVAQMKPKQWRFRGSQRASMGVIAQDMYRIQDNSRLPMVTWKGKYLRIPYMTYIALFAKTVQENQERIDHIRKTIEGRTHGSI